MNLIKEARSGNYVGVEKLLDEGVNIDTCDRYRNTPLMWASRMGYKEVVELLLKRGANVDAQDMHGQTALIQALEREDNEEIIKILLKWGARVDIQDDGFDAGVSGGI